MRGEGLLVEPAGAVSVAGLVRACKDGLIEPDEPVVCVLTGHVLKDPDAVNSYHADGATRANPPLEIEPRLSDVERILGRR